MRSRVGFMVALAIALAACGGDDGDDGAAATDAPTAETSGDASGTASTAADGSSDGPVKFGFLNGQSGDYGPWGEWSRVGAEFAIEEINGAGGVLGRQAELVVEDNKSTPEGAVAGFAKLTEVDNIDVLSGIESDGMMAIFDSVHEQELPTVCDTCGTTELDERGGKFVFRIISSDSDVGLAVAQYARDSGYTNVAMLVEQTEGTLSPAEAFKTVFEERAGGTVIADIRVDPGETSYAAALAAVYADSPEAVYLSIGFDTGLSVLQEWQRRGYGGNLILATDLVHEDIAALVGDSGVAVSTAYDTESPNFASYNERFQERTGQPSESGKFDAFRYDAYILLALAIEAAGTTDGPAVVQAMFEVANAPGTEVTNYADAVAELRAGNDINYQGVSSNLDLNEFGNLASATQAVFAVEDGIWTPSGLFEIDPTLRG